MKNRKSNKDSIEDLLNDPDSYTTWRDSEDEKESKEIKTLIFDHVWGEK